jgi:predicted nucleic acid-binding protein
MKDKILVDTNILVYAYDNSEAIKQAKYISILDQLVKTNCGVITTQILAEFFVTVTRKIPQPLTITEAIKSLENYQKSWLILEITPMIILEAARGVRDYQINFWDAQIWATAKLNQIPTVYSEDFNVDSFLEGVNFINPLK